MRLEKTLASENMGQNAARPVVLSIAGFDPSSGAGITADLKVFAAHGFYGMACIAALTVQSTQGVGAVEPVSAETLAASLEMLAEDVTYSGIKLGMLATGENCAVVADFLERFPGVPVVLDPVLRSSSGRELLETAGVRIMRERLLGQVDWATPNLDELSQMTGLPVTGRQEIPEAAKKLQESVKLIESKKLSLVVTGGHLDRPDDYLLTASGESSWILGERVETKATHGTGCAFSSALLCQLIGGSAPLAAATDAKKYVEAAMRAAYPVGRGSGPMNHLFRLDERPKR